MAYNTEELYKGVQEISLSKGFALLNNKFCSEKEFDINIIPKIPIIIKEMYGLDVSSIHPQKCFNLREQGYYQIIVDLFVETEQGINIVIESKNPIHEKSEIIASFSQLMSYQFLLEKHKIDALYILATSIFDFKYLEFMNRFNIRYDLIINNKER
jgi:hypothetical protein